MTTVSKSTKAPVTTAPKSTKAPVTTAPKSTKAPVTTAPKSATSVVVSDTVAMKIQPNNYVMCPGGSKNCMGPRKDDVVVVPRSSSSSKRTSAPSRIGGSARGQNGAPRV